MKGGKRGKGEKGKKSAAFVEPPCREDVDDAPPRAAGSHRRGHDPTWPGNMGTLPILSNITEIISEKRQANHPRFPKPTSQPAREPEHIPSSCQHIPPVSQSRIQPLAFRVEHSAIHIPQSKIQNPKSSSPFPPFSLNFPPKPYPRNPIPETPTATPWAKYIKGIPWHWPES